MDFENLKHVVPFMALISHNPPPNRPLTTRLIEQGIIGIVAGAIGAYLGISITQARIDQDVSDMHQQITQSDSAHRDQNDYIQAQLVEIRGELMRINRK